VWDTAENRELFVYDPDGALSVNLVFDERQEQTVREQQFQKTLDELKGSHDTAASQYETTLTRYKSEVAAYNAAATQYERNLEAYNQEVQSWNRRGGAPPSAYEELQKKKGALASTSAALARQRQDANALADTLNTLGAAANQLAQQYNSDVSNYNQQFSGQEDFNEGEYQDGRVTIYQFNTQDDLRLVLTHELGHALGMEHVQNPKSIMYYLLQAQDAAHITPTAEDLAELMRVCPLK
jgi:hypothetical protein